MIAEDLFEIIKRMLHDSSVPNTVENHRYDFEYRYTNEIRFTLAFAPKWILTWPNLDSLLHGDDRMTSIFGTCCNIINQIDNYNSYTNTPIPPDKVAKMRVLAKLCEASDAERLLTLTVAGY